MRNPLDQLGNIIKEGNMVCIFLSQGKNYVIGHVMGVDPGGVAGVSSENPRGFLLPARVMIHVEIANNCDPEGVMKNVIVVKEPKETPPPPSGIVGVS